MSSEKEKKIKSTAVELSIDKDNEIVEKMHCLVTGKKIDSMMDSNRARIKISKIIMQGAKTTNACRCMSLAIVIKDNRMVNGAKCAPIAAAIEEETNADPAINEEEAKHADLIINPVTIKTKKERRLKSCMNLSTRCKIEQLGKIKHLISKIANPPKEKNECIH